MRVLDGCPENSGEYLCFHVRHGFGIYGYSRTWGFGDSNVTHWWHLPTEPYKPQAVKLGGTEALAKKELPQVVEPTTK